MDKNCIYNETLTISFKYSIDNKKYRLEHITKQKGKANEILEELHKKLQEITSTKLIDFQDKPKSTGYEMIKLSEMNFNLNDKIKNELRISNESKLIIFRFCKGKYRIIAIQSRICPYLLYILGYDWNYNAYNHGK